MARLLPSSQKRVPPKRKRFLIEGEEDEETQEEVAPPKKKSGRPSILATYDSEIIQLAKYRFTSAQIAIALQLKYGLSSLVCSTKSIDNRINYLKLNGAPIPPTNNSIDLHAGLCE